MSDIDFMLDKADLAGLDDAKNGRVIGCWYCGEYKPASDFEGAAVMCRNCEDADRADAQKADHVLAVLEDMVAVRGRLGPPREIR